MSFLTPPPFKADQTGPEADARYKRLRLQVFLGIFIGYAGFYIVRKNFSMAIPMLAPFGFEKGDLSIVRAKTTQPLGAGPYKFVEFKDGRVYFEANESYFKGAPKK